MSSGQAVKIGLIQRYRVKLICAACLYYFKRIVGINEQLKNNV